MNKLFKIQSLILLAGTIFSWFTVYSDFSRFYLVVVYFKEKSGRKNNTREKIDNIAYRQHNFCLEQFFSGDV